jgi:PAS domain S-box-containing protein
MGDPNERSGKIKAKPQTHAKTGMEDTLPSILDTVSAPPPATAKIGGSSTDLGGMRSENLEALLDVSKAINSTLDLDEILKRVMKHAIELLNAERGFLMLLDDNDHLQVRTAHNINKELLTSQEDLAISRSVADRVAAKGQSEYTSNAQEDPRYAHQKSVAELNLRFIICVPLKIKEKVIGVCYLDNQSRARLFGKSDLRLFELFAEQAAIAIENAKLYGRLLSLTRYNENVVNKTPVGICVVDHQSRIITFNATAEQIFRSPDAAWTATSLVSEHALFVDILPSSERDWWGEVIADVMRSHKPMTKERHFITIGGRETALSIKISPLNGIVGEIPKIIIVVEDITDQVLLEKYVIHSEKMVAKGELAASIGHEMNNHLEILLAHSELMPMYVKQSRLDQLADSCTKIQDSIDNMTRFSRSLMDYSQFETELLEHNLKDLIEGHLFTIRPSRSFQSVRFVTDLEPGLPSVKLDAGQINSVLLNLYKNAVEAAAGGPPCEIHIRARHLAAREMVEISVRDNGPGIPADVAAQLFQSRLTTKSGGHGLGLLNCKTIVQNHGGTITVESAPGQGTTFTMTLPAHHPFASFES